MSYLLTEIVVYLVIAGLIGFAFGWAVRDGVLDKYLDKVIELIKKAWTAIKSFFSKIKSYFSNLELFKKSNETKENVAEEPIIEIANEVEAEVSSSTETIEAIDDKNKPILLAVAPTDGVDKLSSIKGIGPVLEKKLNELGVYSFEQIASWDSEQEVWIGAQMAFPKRVTKEEWVKQAKEFLKNK